MRHTILGSGLFMVSSVISTVLWFATEPGLSLNQPSYTSTPSSEVSINDTTFIKPLKVSPNEDASEPLAEDRALPMNVSYGDTYGVNETFIKRVCHDIKQRTR